ncbi:hypothetical protein ACNR9Z_000953 [Candidozyma auris]
MSSGKYKELDQTLSDSETDVAPLPKPSLPTETASSSESSLVREYEDAEQPSETLFVQSAAEGSSANLRDGNIGNDENVQSMSPGSLEEQRSPAPGRLSPSQSAIVSKPGHEFEKNDLHSYYSNKHELSALQRCQIAVSVNHVTKGNNLGTDVFRVPH